MFSKKASHYFSIFNPIRYGFSGNLDYLSLRIKRSDILKASSTPLISPSYPFGPYRFIGREYMIISYETDPEALQKVIPAPLKPSKENIVHYEWMNMPDCSGIGSYSESGTVVPCEFNGEPLNFTLQMYLNNEPPISAGREIWGFPKKFGVPNLSTQKDTLVGKLSYSGEEIAMGTMSYKYKKITKNDAKTALLRTGCNLKLIPGVDLQSPDVAQLISYKLEDVIIKEAWEGPARLHLRSHINAPTLILPIRRIIGGKHIIADVTLPYGTILYDYLKHPEFNKFNWSFKEHSTTLDFSRIQDVMKSLCLPIIAPSYSCGPFELKKRDHVIFRYRTDPKALARALPEPLIPNENNEIFILFTNVEGDGLGCYNKCDMYIPCYFQGKYVHFGVQTYIDSSATRTFGREIFGLPCKIGQPMIAVRKDTIVSKLIYGEEEVIMGTMTYHHKTWSAEEAIEFLKVPLVNIKFIPGAEQDKVDIARLTMYHNEEIIIHSAYRGHASIELTPHVNAPMADLPVKDILEGFTINADMKMSVAKVIHDYKNTGN